MKSAEQITSNQFVATYYLPVTKYKQSKATTGQWVPTLRKALVHMRTPSWTSQRPPPQSSDWEESLT